MTDSRQETRTAGVIAPPPLIYAVPLAVALVIERLIPTQIAPPRWTLGLGIGCLSLGLIALPAVFAFRRADTRPEPWRPTTALVTSGPYRYSRNPMYVGFTLFYLGITLLVNTVWPLLLLPVVLLVMSVAVIAREEVYLEALFGEPYRAYRARVRRWL